MSDEKKIIVIRAKKHIARQKLKDFHQLWSNQIKEGVVLIPDDFEFVALDPNTFEQCPLDWQEAKKPSLWERIKRRCKHV